MVSQNADLVKITVIGVQSIRNVFGAVTLVCLYIDTDDIQTSTEDYLFFDDFQDCVFGGVFNIVLGAAICAL